MLLNDMGVGISDADESTLLDNVELLVEGHHLDAAILVTNNALGNSVEIASIVPSTLADHSHRVHLEVHVDTGAWLQLRHRDEHWLAQGRSRLLLGAGLSRFHFFDFLF